MQVVYMVQTFDAGQYPENKVYRGFFDMEQALAFLDNYAANFNQDFAYVSHEEIEDDDILFTYRSADGQERYMTGHVNEDGSRRGGEAVIWYHRYNAETGRFADESDHSYVAIETFNKEETRAQIIEDQEIDVDNCCNQGFNEFIREFGSVIVNAQEMRENIIVMDTDSDNEGNFSSDDDPGLLGVDQSDSDLEM